jgi:predicted RNase H-like HicB family nuclease
MACKPGDLVLIPFPFSDLQSAKKRPKQALSEVERAKTAWLEAAEREGKPIPPPRYRPIIYQVAR